jgi:hypothetical protein
MKEKEKGKTMPPREDDLLSQLNTNLYALAGYLAGFLAMLRASPRPRPR